MQNKGSEMSKEHILVCLSSSPSNERIVRMAEKMAQAFCGSLTALYVQTPGDADMNAEDTVRLQANMYLAQQLGAEIVTTHGEDVPTQIAEYARLSDVTKIVIGRSGVKRQHFWSEPTLTERLIALAPEVDIHIIPDAEVYKSYRRNRLIAICPALPTAWELLLTVGILAAATIIGWGFLRLGFADANIIMVYLLGVLLTSAFTSGYICGVLSAFLSVILFNYFLTEPRLSLVAYGSKYPITFAVMFAAALLTGTLAAKLKAHAQLSARDAYRTKLLFDMNRQLQKAETPEEVYRMTAMQIQKLMQRDVLICPAQGGALLDEIIYPVDGRSPYSISDADGEQNVIQWVWQNRKRAGATTHNFPKAKWLYLAIRTGQQVFGVVGILMDKQTQPDAFTSSVLFSILGECALALESLHNAAENEKAAVFAKNEQLRANLLRSISHDLRTPLTSISGNADTLLHSYNALDEQTRKQIFTDIYDDAQWLTGLVENLLSITKISDGSVKLRLSDQVVDDIVSEAFRHIDRRSTKHHIEVDCGDVPLLVRVDAGLIVQVLINLVNNAVKYTPTGSNIRITAIPRENMAEICVSDNGPGISDELKERVFEMFFTGSNPIGDSRRSLGLGLTLCQTIIHAHNGEMTLKTHEYRYLSAQNGASAVLEALSHNPDIVLLDLGLPDMDGVEIIRKIRSWSNMPIIVISARTEDSDKIGALDAGADDYLTKPFSVDELLARLRVTQRRLSLMKADTAQETPIFTNGALKIDYAAGCAYIDGAELHLTPIEYKLLCLLSKNVGKVLTHTYITQQIWGSSWENDIASLRVFMATLRKKLENGKDGQQYIQTHIGIGYRMLRVE